MDLQQNSQRISGGAAATLAETDLSAGSRSRRGRIAPVTNSSRRRTIVSYAGISRAVALLDVCLIVSAATVSGITYKYLAFDIVDEAGRTLVVSGFVAIFFVFMTHIRKLYDPTLMLMWNDQFKHVLITWCCTLIFLGGLIFSLGASKSASRGALLLFSISGVVALLGNRLFWRFFLERARDIGSVRGRKVIIVGWGVSAASEFIECSKQHGLEVQQEFHLIDSASSQKDGVLAKIVSYVRGSDVEEIFLIGRKNDGIGDILDHLRILPIPVTLIADDATAELVRQPWSKIGNSVAIELQRPPLTAFEQACKRAIDIIAASSGLIMLMPLLIFVAIAIKIDSGGPIFFRQTRQGFNGKAFKIFKFRSMSVLEDGATIVQATANDHRVTRFGAVLRKTSIDEIPQLINVLRGEMSMVGPRPHALAHDDYFSQRIGNYAFRHHVKPGITGWAQVHGYRGETHTLKKMKHRVEYDIWYVNNWSILLDLEIMLRTLGEVLKGENAY